MFAHYCDLCLLKQYIEKSTMLKYLIVNGLLNIYTNIKYYLDLDLERTLWSAIVLLRDGAPVLSLEEHCCRRKSISVCPSPLRFDDCDPWWEMEFRFVVLLSLRKSFGYWPCEFEAIDEYLKDCWSGPQPTESKWDEKDPLFFTIYVYIYILYYIIIIIIIIKLIRLLSC